MTEIHRDRRRDVVGRLTPSPEPNARVRLFLSDDWEEIFLQWLGIDGEPRFFTVEGYDVISMDHRGAMHLMVALGDALREAQSLRGARKRR
jgi:hypothetical protein